MFSTRLLLWCVDVIMSGVVDGMGDSYCQRLKYSHVIGFEITSTHARW